VSALQWGGRFTGAPDPELIAFGSSLREDLLLAPFDVECSLAHVAALEGGGIVDADAAEALRAALGRVRMEIADGAFAQFASAGTFEDVHGAIDARVRELAGDAGESLHAGRSRNDQVATTLLLYVRDRARQCALRAHAIAAALADSAAAELEAGTLVAGATHRQPAQPLLLAFVIAAWSEPFVRAGRRFLDVEESTHEECPLGSGALAGSSLPLERDSAARALGFARPSRNALDAIGNRDAALDLAHASVRALVDASRICEELIAWSMPSYGYARLGDAAATGSSLMPQKRNPDPFELVRAHAAGAIGTYAGMLGTLCGLAPSYQRDLQITKQQAIALVEDALVSLKAFERAIDAVVYNREAMSGRASEGYTIATDVADALIARGLSARAAHAAVGAAVAEAESAGRALKDEDLGRLAALAGIGSLDAPLSAAESVRAKKTAGSTSPDAVRAHLDALRGDLAALEQRLA
jgi:argininosuccinate lyase